MRSSRIANLSLVRFGQVCDFLERLLGLEHLKVSGFVLQIIFSNAQSAVVDEVVFGAMVILGIQESLPRKWKPR